MLEKLKSYFSPHAEVAKHHKKRIRELERIIGIEINDPFLFIRALRHRSILADDKFTPADSYERLEFLGDAVLDLIITEIIYERFPEEDEGFMTKLRAKLVKGDTLADFARTLDLNSLLVLGERAQGQGIEFSKSVLSDVFEALIGAIYLDQGYRKAFDFVSGVIKNNIDFDQVTGSLDNFKSMLLEYAQAQQLSIPVYEVVNEEGPGHDKTFEVRVMVDKKEQGSGKGKSKKEAEQAAARKALRELGELG